MARTFAGAGRFTGSDLGLPFGSAARTFSVRIRTTSHPGTAQTIAAYGTRSTNQVFSLGMLNATNLFLSQFGANINGTVTFYDDLWHLVVVTVTGSSWVFKFDNSTLTSGSMTTNTVSHSVDLGNDYAGSDPKWNGSMAEVTIWDTLLTADEQTALFNGVAPHSVRPLSLLYYAPLNGLSNSVEQELVGSRTLTLVGTSTVSASHPRIAAVSPTVGGRLVTGGTAVTPEQWRNQWRDQKRVFDYAEIAEQDEATHLQLMGRRRQPFPWAGPGGHVDAIGVGKFIQYVALMSVSVPPMPTRIVRWMLDGIQQMDVGFEDVPNLNLRRRVQTPFGAYYVRPPPLPTPPFLRRREHASWEVDEEHELALNQVMRRPVALAPAPTPAPLPFPMLDARRLVAINAAYALDELELDLNRVMRRAAAAPEVVPTPTVLAFDFRKLSVRDAHMLEEELEAGHALLLRVTAAGRVVLVSAATGRSYFPLIVMA